MDNAHVGKSLIRVVAAVIERDGHYLVTQRQPEAVLPLLWEFPGGRVEEGESEEAALCREVRGRIGADVHIIDRMGEHLHEYEGYDVHLTLFVCELAEGASPRPLAVHDLRWVASDQLANYRFPPADQNSMDKLLGISRGRRS